MERSVEAEIRQYESCLQEWDAAYEEYAKSVGLSYTGLAILGILYESEKCTQKMLCRQCFLQKQTVNAVITSFYKKGWVRLEKLLEDRRNKAVSLTVAGRQQAGQILAPIYRSERQALCRLTEEERRGLLSATQKYVAGFKEMLQKP